LRVGEKAKILQQDYFGTKNLFGPVVAFLEVIILTFGKEPGEFLLF